MFCSYRISTDKLSRGPSAIAEPLVLNRQLLSYTSATMPGTRASLKSSKKVSDQKFYKLLLKRTPCMGLNYRKACLSSKIQNKSPHNRPRAYTKKSYANIIGTDENLHFVPIYR